MPYGRIRALPLVRCVGCCEPLSNHCSAWGPSGCVEPPAVLRDFVFSLQRASSNLELVGHGASGVAMKMNTMAPSMFSQNLVFSNREAEVIVRKLQVCSCGAALAITTLGEQAEYILVTREVTARDRRQEGRKFTHPWQPTRLNGWNSVYLSSARHSMEASNDVPANHGLVFGPHKPSHDT